MLTSSIPVKAEGRSASGAADQLSAEPADRVRATTNSGTDWAPGSTRATHTLVHEALSDLLFRRAAGLKDRSLAQHMTEIEWTLPP